MRQSAFPTLAVLLAALPVQAGPGEDLAAAYCAAVVAHDEAAAVGLMDPILQAAVAKAREVSAAFESSHPGEKPPLGDGLRLTAFPDAVETCHMAATDDGTLRLTYVPYGAPDGAWTDVILPAAGQGGVFAVGDIRFSASPDDTLSAWLDQAALP